MILYLFNSNSFFFNLFLIKHIFSKLNSYLIQNVSKIPFSISLPNGPLLEGLFSQFFLEIETCYSWANA